MPLYHYQALNSNGVTFEGMLRADSERDAARQLERRGLSVIEVRSGGMAAITVLAEKGAAEPSS